MKTGLLKVGQRMVHVRRRSSLAEADATALRRYWVSWQNAYDDPRLMIGLPFSCEAIAGYWRSGEGGATSAYVNVCVVVDATSEEEATAAIRSVWPKAGVGDVWRFFDEKPLDWVPDPFRFSAIHPEDRKRLHRHATEA